MELEIVKLEHLPEDYTIHIALFHDVENAAFLHEQLLGRNSDFEYAFIDASVVWIPHFSLPYLISPSCRILNCLVASLS